MVSSAGGFLQLTAELWAITTITGSGAALGLHAVLRFGPMVFLGLYGGVLSDRLDRRKLLLVTQSTLLVAALVLWIGWSLGHQSLWLLYSVVLVQGLVNAVDNPLRRTFIRDLVEDDLLTNAIGLEGASSTLARTIGPAIAGVVIAQGGLSWCFALNALSFLAMLVSVLLLDQDKMRVAAVVPRARGQIRLGLQYAWNSPIIMQTLTLSAVVAVFGWNWQTLLPLYASDSLDGGPEMFGLLVALLSIGALGGALATARLPRPGKRTLMVACLALALALALTALAPTFRTAIVGVMLLGLAGTIVNISSQTRLQLIVTDEMTGRLMALYSMCWLGTRPLGGIIGGTLIDTVGPRGAFLVGALVIAGTAIFLTVTRASEDDAPVDSHLPRS